jgi:hypothetical protein
MRFHQKRGPEFYKDYFESRKGIIILSYALGNKICPFSLFDTIKYIWLLNDEMREHVRNFYAQQKYSKLLITFSQIL